MTPSPPSPTHVLYIYYRTPDTPDALRGELHAFLRHVQERTGVGGRLLCRRSSDGQTLTWLEAYEAVPNDFRQVLRALWSDFAIDKTPYGDRREEQFEVVG